MADKALFSSRRTASRTTTRAKLRRDLPVRNLLESLETRQLMAVTSASFNFQPAGSFVPAGFIVDSGKAFSSQNGQQYGWNTTNTAATRDRNTASTSETDTLIHFGPASAAKNVASTWEVAVPNGTYNVSLTAGDASYTDSKYAISVEGTTVLSGTPSSSNHWITGNGVVNVTDGRLTVTSAAGAINNKLNSLKLSTTTASPAGVTKPSAATGVTATATSTTAALIKWNDVSLENGYKVERSTDNKVFYNIATVGANVTSYNDTSLRTGTKYYYRIQAFNGGGLTPSAVVTVSNSSVTAPNSTSWVGASATGSSTATVTWGDVTSETGYIIEKATDGKTFNEAGRVGANVTTYTASGLSASSSYTFRVKAFNAGGVSPASVVQTIKTASAPVVTPPPVNVPSQPNSPIVNGNSLSGVSVNGGTSDDYTSPLRDLGIKNVRLWYNTSWNSTSVSKWYADRAADYKARGFKVMMVVIQDHPTDYNTAKRFYSMLANDAGLRNSVDYWQVGNEPNIGKFWSGSMSQYVNTHLKPAYEALHARGETVVGAGPSWDVNVAKQLQSLGYSNYCDFAAFHPYADSAQQMLTAAAGAKAAFGNKPIMFTEWNISGHGGDKAGWIRELKIAGPGLAKIGALSFYFGMRVDNTHVGGGGLINANGSHNTPFYELIKDWLN